MGTTPLWPSATTEADLDSLRSRTPELLAGVRAIALRHALPAHRLEHVPGGSLPVFALQGKRMLKLYPPSCRTSFVTESRVLAHLDGRIPAPRIIVAGEIDDWSYVVMTRLPGIALGDRAGHGTWDALTGGERLRLAGELGGLLRTLHELSTTELGLPPPTWRDFLAVQVGGAARAQAALGLEPRWLEQLDPFLQSVALPAGLPVLLHTEIAREHVFVELRDGRWTLSGILDFEPAMIGTAEYEFASVGMFTSMGDAGFLRALLLGYGYDERSLEADAAVPLQKRLLAYTVLHRYSSLPWYLRRMPPPRAVRTLDQLARQWFALGEGRGRE